MITVTLNRTEFEYDIHSLIKAFFPKEDVELYYTKEAHADEKNVACTNHSAEQEEAGSSHFSIDYADDRISIAWDDAPDGPARRTFAVDFSNRTETKNALKEHLYRLLEERRDQRPEGSYTTYLFEKGLDKILKKVGEECTEVIIAAKAQDHRETVYEIADLAYHVMVLMVQAGVSLEEVREELAGRHIIDHKVKQEKMVSDQA